jgi:uncharacterized membrane protein
MGVVMERNETRQDALVSSQLGRALREYMPHGTNMHLIAGYLAILGIDCRLSGISWN